MMFGNRSDLLQNAWNEAEFVSGTKQGFAGDSRNNRCKDFTGLPVQKLEGQGEGREIRRET